VCYERRMANVGSREKARNVLGGPLATCSLKPKTGYFRDGCCNTDATDRGSHTVCTRVTAEFLAFSKAKGNDLTTPAPAHGFPGLKAGDSWCLCAARWKEAYDAGVAPMVVLAATHEKALEIVPFEALKRFGIDLN
jgi:uncharacterized protein